MLNITGVSLPMGPLEVLEHAMHVVVIIVDVFSHRVDHVSVEAAWTRE